MAIIVEEGRKRTNILGIAGWIVFIGIAAAAVYYIFFTAPELVPIVATGNLSTIAPIADVNLNPQSIVGSAQFQSLQSNIALPTPTSPNGVGRPNPFIAP